MQTRAVLTYLLLMPLIVTAVNAEEPAKKSKSKEKNADVAAIQTAIDSYVEAFNAADAQRVAAHWSDNAVYILPHTGKKVSGRKAIAKVFAEVFDGQERSHLRVQVDSIRLITPDVAIEDGAAWVVSADGEEERSTYSAVHVKGKTGWLLDSVRETAAHAEPEIAGGQEQLQELEWMLGDWIDESEDATIEYSAHYAKNNSFMVRLFKVSAPGADDLEGTQIIGWDPTTEAIHSWVFDSDGGFSQGAWSRQGKKWLVKSTGFTAGGHRTASIGSFQQVDENTLRWGVSGREVGGEKLPDIAEVKIVRKQAE